MENMKSADEGMNMAHMSYNCDGGPWMDGGEAKNGAWLFHVLAGVVLLIWAIHWNAGIFKAWLMQTKDKPYRGQTAFPLPFVSPKWPIESVLKVMIPLGAVFGNLLSPSGWMSTSLCPDGTVRQGHFNPDHIDHYANVWVLLPFLISGLVDLLSWFMELPSGTQHFFMSAAFMLESFILVTGQHSGMIDQMVYYLLFMCAAGTAVFLLSEMLWPGSFFASCGKVYCLYMQAIWYFGAARILYEGRPAWDTMKPYPDMAPAAFVPVPFVFWMNVTSLTMFLGYIGMRLVLRAQGYTCSAEETSAHQHTEMDHGSGYRAVARSAAQGASELVPLTARHFTLK